MDNEILEEVLSVLAKNGRPDLIQAVRILYTDFLKSIEEDPEYDFEEEEAEENIRVFTNHEHYEFHEGSADEEHYGYAVDDDGHFSLI
tara:strand:- start:2970 stop:3233 length:264 start_codon:yes stop_codon:yes gene_type:complete